jgi:hypothetical protein
MPLFLRFQKSKVRAATTATASTDLVSDALIEGFSNRLVAAIQTVKGQELVQSTQATLEHIVAHLHTVSDRAASQSFSGKHAGPFIADSALTPVVHGCDLLSALPLTASSVQQQKCVALLCGVSWHTAGDSPALASVHKLIAKLLQSDWNCNNVCEV